MKISTSAAVFTTTLQLLPIADAVEKPQSLEAMVVTAEFAMMGSTRGMAGISMSVPPSNSKRSS